MAQVPWWRRLDGRRILSGVGIGLGLSLTLTAVGAWALAGEVLSREWENYLGVGILLVSAFAGSLVARVGEAMAWNVVMVGLGYWVGLAMIHLLVLEGPMSGMLPTAMAILGGCGCGILLPGGGKGRSRSRRTRRKYRRRETVQKTGR